MKRKILLVTILLCLCLIVYKNLTEEKRRVRTPEDTDSEFYLEFGEEDAERIDKIVLRKQDAETYGTNAEIEITDPDVIREIADQILALKLTENENIDTNGLRENRIIISFNVSGPEMNLYVGSDNRLLFDRITCSTDTKVVVEHALFIAEPQIDFEQWWELAETSK